MTQLITSAATSRWIVPGLFADVEKRVGWERGTVNLDVGGGRFDRGTEYLAARGVENLVLDPFNRSPEHNAAVLRRLTAAPAATATCSNVLNVVELRDHRQAVVERCALAVLRHGVAYFSVYYDPRGRHGPTRDGWQEHRPLRDYVGEVAPHFDLVELFGSAFIRAARAH